ncbi:hypothetical protein KKG51_02385 [Patescibacteria group bacterium]|nr:hypothetical protein [Patescibacteria group bacterium]
MQKILKIVAGIVFTLLFAGVLIQLFYPELIDSFLGGQKHKTGDYSRDLVIALDSEHRDLEPTFYDLATRNRLLQMYEPLVMPDANLSIKPLLALSFGQLDAKSWMFRIRSGVKFHDETELDADDVIASIKRAKNYEDSHLRDILSNIDEIFKVSDTEIEIHLKDKDPLFLSKISTVLIVPGEYQRGDIKKPVGTGPYMYVKEDGKGLSMKRFEEYWGNKALYKSVSVVSLLTAQDFDIAANVPPAFLERLEREGKQIMTIVPSMEVTYLVFNFNSEVFEDIDMREAVKLALDRSVFEEMGGSHVLPASQFVSGGVYGFNPEIEVSEQDVLLAKNYVKLVYSFDRPEVTLDILTGQEAVGDYIKKQLSDVGIDVYVNVLPFEELEERVMAGEADMYVLGFRNELGDSYDFYRTAVYKGARYNGGNYDNEIVNDMIDKSITEMNQRKRSEILREIMTILVDEDIYGVPLYESQLIYAVDADTVYAPRIDGYILAKEAK